MDERVFEATDRCTGEPFRSARHHLLSAWLGDFPDLSEEPNTAGMTQLMIDEPAI